MPGSDVEIQKLERRSVQPPYAAYADEWLLVRTPVRLQDHREAPMQASDSKSTGRLRINGQRLWQSLMDLARIGATDKGGVRRLALTDLDRQGRDLVIGWLRDAGASIEIDGAGNIFATRPGHEGHTAVVLTGSHVDTQPSGGKFDGNYGGLA